MPNNDLSFPLVSIIIPSYNHSQYIKETIESIVLQTYKNIELIVIDDGSKDSSVKVIQDLANKYKFKFISRPNKGLSATLNEGLELSTGKYFSICASDDIYMLNKIQKQVEFMEFNPEYGMCYGKIAHFKTSTRESIEIKSSMKNGFIYTDLLYSNFIPAPSVLIRKDLFTDVGNFDETLWIEDWDMWLRISKKYQIGYINQCLVYYRQHQSNISKQSLKMYEAEKKILAKHQMVDNFDTIINRKKIDWFYKLSRSHKSEALKYFFHSIKYLISDTRVIKGIIKLVFFK